MDEKSWDADSHTEENLPSFTFNDRHIRNMAVAELIANDVFYDECRYQYLQVCRPG